MCVSNSSAARSCFTAVSLSAISSASSSYRALRASDGTIAPAVTPPSPSFDRVLQVPLARWSEPVAAPMLARAVSALEDGCVLYFPQLAFELTAGEERFLSERWHNGKAKNMSYDVKSGQVGGTSAEGSDR